MALEVGCTNHHTVGKSQRVNQVQVVALDGDNVARHRCRRRETLELDRLGIGQRTLTGNRLVGLRGQGDNTFRRTVLGHGDANLTGYARLHDIEVGNGTDARNLYAGNLVEVATHEAQLTATHHRIRTVCIEADTALILVGAQLVLAARCQG